MVRHSKRCPFLTIVFVLIFFTFAFPYNTVEVFVLTPPELLLNNVKQIAILNFDGEYGQEFADRFVTQLLKKDRGITKVSKGFFRSSVEGQTFQKGTFTNIFEVVERGKMSKILEEQQISNSGLVDQGQAIEIGKLAGVQAIVTGAVSYTQETTDGTVEQTSKNGTILVPARFRRVDVTYKIKILDVQTGKILGSIDRSNGLEDRKYGNEINNIFSIATGVDACVTGLALDAANYITPNYVLQEYELQEIEIDEFEDICEEAADKAEEYDIDASYLLYKSIFDKDPYNHKLLYNLGILNEVVGNFKIAQEYYNQALQLKNNEEDYENAVVRINKSVEFSDVLTQIGIAIKEHNFEFSDADQQAALSKKIEINGDEGDRVFVYKTADNSSEIMAKIPGGTTFSILAEEGEFFKIKLFGGKEGYVHSDDASIE